MISYAQNFEDVMLVRVFGSRSTGFYIDVGAMDPIDGSVTKHFYDLGWCGINIEPDVRFYEKLILERTRDVNLNTALGESEGTLPFYEFEMQGVSTFNPKFRQYFADRGSDFHTRQQKVTTLADICEHQVTCEIDFLKIDAEGWEGPIIRGADWVKFRPVVLVVEGTEPYSHTPAWESWEPYLIGAGYTFVYYDGLNRFYLRDESVDALRDCFAYPPNVLDGFKLAVTEEAERWRERLFVENRTLEARIESANREQKAAIESLVREYETAVEALKDLNQASLSELEAVKAKLGLAHQEQNRLVVEQRDLAAQLERMVMESRIDTGRIAQEKALAGQLADRLLGDLRAEREHRERAERESESLRHRLDLAWADKEKCGCTTYT